MSAHTPGPWVVGSDNAWDLDHESGIASWWGILSPDGGAVAFAVGCLATAKDDECDANARLIAAAPELLEACKALDKFWCEDFTPPEEPDERRILTPECVAIWHAIRAAIAKATGAS